MKYPIVILPDSSDSLAMIEYYRVDLEAAVLLVQKFLVDSGETTIDAEIESLLRPRS